jgi:hypothetical protein
VREDVYPNLTATLDESGHSDSGCFDLVRCNSAAFLGYETVLAVSNDIALVRSASDSAAVLHSSFNSLGD